MSSPLPKLVVFCVLLSASTTASASLLKMGITPSTAFPPGKQLSVIGQAFNIPTAGIHPMKLRLQDGRTDLSWNFIPASVHTVDVDFGPPAANNWSGASFPAFPAPPNSPTHRFKVVTTVLMWTTAGAPGRGTYLPAPGWNRGVAVFQYKCIPLTPRQVRCSWQRQ